MSMSSDKTFWGFLFYVKHNPYKSVEQMTWDDLHEMAKLWAVENGTAQTITAATALSHANQGFGVVDFSTDITFPAYAAATRTSTVGAGTAAGASLAANKLICETAMYPERGI